MTQEELFNREERQKLLKFVRDVIQSRFDQASTPSIENMDGKLNETGSCFVTLHTSDGMLRGCIGNIAAFEPLGQNIARNALNSAFNDPRFPSLAIDELAYVEIELSILTPMQEIASPDDFIVGEHGIVLQCNGRSAVFLPQVAPEQKWDRATTLSHLSMKAGLSPDAWKSPEAKFSVFKAIVFSEKDYR
jgi:AmmeMemoRadiSam system protein A